MVNRACILKHQVPMIDIGFDFLIALGAELVYCFRLEHVKGIVLGISSRAVAGFEGAEVL